MKPTTAIIVTHNQGVITVAIENLVAAAEVRGWKVVGFKKALWVPLREEIEGQPMFDKLAGPFYGGDGIVRYEDARTFNDLST
jgi:hypothetical protein